MNQFVPQLILGNALDGTSGPPDYKPHWGHHETYMFGAHYFFEHTNGSGAAYGKLFPAYVGETLYTSFTQVRSASSPGGPPATTPDPLESGADTAVVACGYCTASDRSQRRLWLDTDDGCSQRLGPDQHSAG